MNKISYLQRCFLFVLLITVAFFSSCLKSNDTFADFSKVGTTIELPLAALNQETNVKIKVQSYKDTITTSPELPVVVNIASPSTLKKDLTVTLGINANEALAKYNTVNKTEYILLPATLYTVSNLTLTIPKGQRTATAVFKINFSTIDKTITKYVLPVSIVDASGEQISNYNTVYYNILATK